MDSIGNGLLNDKQKYRNGQPQAIEMKEISKKYDYVNFDDQEEHVVRMSKPSDQQQQRQPMQQGTKNQQQPMGYAQQQHNQVERPPNVQQQTGNVADYPSFDYQPLPTTNNLPSYSSGVGRPGAPQPPQGPTGQQPNYYQPKYNQYQSGYQPYPQQYQSNYYQPYGYGYNAGCSPIYPGLSKSFFGYERPSYYGCDSQLYIPGVSHGELRPATYQSNINSSRAPQVQPSPTVDNRSRISLNGMHFATGPTNPAPQQPINQSTIQRKPPQEKVVVPDMLVTCHLCVCPQNIPGDSTIYVCYNCQRRVKCFPTHNIFKCSSCNKRVCYQLGTSHLIKCGYCKTVNQVPVSLEESINMSVNASRIEPSREEEKQPVHATGTPKPPRKEVQAEPLLQPNLQYPAINHEDDGFDEISEIIRKSDEPEPHPAPRQ